MPYIGLVLDALVHAFLVSLLDAFHMYVLYACLTYMPYVYALRMCLTYMPY